MAHLYKSTMLVDKDKPYKLFKKISRRYILTDLTRRDYNYRSLVAQVRAPKHKTYKVLGRDFLNPRV
jgi:hypothetical protein